MLTTPPFSLNYIFWGTIGLARFVFNRLTWFVKHGEINIPYDPRVMTKTDVCVCLPARNEELTIEKSILSLLKLLPPKQIYIVSDGSSDRTVAIAAKMRVKVLELKINRGKARAVKALIDHFDLLNNYRLILSADADSILPVDYLDKALPLFKDKRMAAVAGYAVSRWEDNKFIAHRQKIFTWGQLLSRYGQSWQLFNVNWVIPGFASIYRTSVLKQIDMDAKGVVTEDLYSTFEVHRKKLGYIYHSPYIYAHTQDPNNLKEYMRQIDRWNLGLWQTLRIQRLWWSKFCLFFSINILENLLYGLFLLISPLMIIAALAIIFIGWAGFMPEMLIKLSWFYLLLIVGFWLTSLIVALVAATIERQPRIVYWALRSPWIYYVDIWSFFRTIPLAFRASSNGSWVPPERR